MGISEENTLTPHPEVLALASLEASAASKLPHFRRVVSAMETR